MLLLRSHSPFAVSQTLKHLSATPPGTHAATRWWKWSRLPSRLTAKCTISNWGTFKLHRSGSREDECAQLFFVFFPPSSQIACLTLTGGSERRQGRLAFGSRRRLQSITQQPAHSGWKGLRRSLHVGHVRHTHLSQQGGEVFTDRETSQEEEGF